MEHNAPEPTAAHAKDGRSDLMAELQSVRDGVEQLYLLLDHIWRNREELYDLFFAESGRNDNSEETESIACALCDVDSPPSLAAAIREGWVRLQYNDGPGWNFLGICPECFAEESRVPEPEASPSNKQAQLFA